MEHFFSVDKNRLSKLPKFLRISNEINQSEEQELFSKVNERYLTRSPSKRADSIASNISITVSGCGIFSYHILGVLSKKVFLTKFSPM